MSVLVGKQAPDFKAQAVMGDGSFQEVSLSQYRDKYVVLFFYPLDFTFVCPTEIIAFDHRLEEFEKRNVQVLGVSVDSHYSHFAWRETPVEKGGIGRIRYPLIADIKKEIARAYDVLFDDSVALRASFLIDRAGVVQHQVVNNLGLGRNIDEMLRMVDALQFFEEHGEVCPANWKPGSEAMKADPQGVAEYLAKHANEL
ncbi:peroxiredoxin [Inmirania thermothiophila]|uniref:Thioredoxin peroxidase n=1 Tax=Inmirania thermothiophila TaxID=1750597 RepID=A0A3N1Y617_9GAMM|nr:peroxiredoxin [Inmirania thermothiophila]ROR32747.1 peroxiredoxin (alkyl hydroperoxide reductase subunit C) [Inmirania thermothiophila]